MPRTKEQLESDIAEVEKLIALADRLATKLKRSTALRSKSGIQNKRDQTCWICKQRHKICPACVAAWSARKTCVSLRQHRKWLQGAR